MNEGRAREVAWPYALAIPLVLAAVHWPVLVGQAIYFHNDLWQWFLPVHEYLRRELWAGNRLPWCPLVGCGYPLAAEPQTGLWYPLNLLLAIPLPIGLMMGWLLWLHSVIAGLGVFALARQWRLPPLGAMVAGLIFSATGFMIAHLHHVAIITAAAWFPWAWYGLLAHRMDAWAHAAARGHAAAWARRSPARILIPRVGDRRAYAVLVAWCSAAQLLAGQPQVWLLTFVSGFVMLAVAEALLRDTELAFPKAGRLRSWLVLLAAAALGVGIAGVTLLPMLSLYAISERAKSTLDFVMSYCLSRESLSTLLGIRLQTGDYWEYEAFAGLSTLALVVLAIVRGKQRPALYLLCALVLFALFMGLAQVNPIYRLFPHVPLLSGMRCAGRWIIVVSLCLSLLAAYGLQVLRRWRWVMWAAAAVVVAEVAWFGAHYNPKASPELLQPPPQVGLMQGGRLVSAPPSRLPEHLSQTDQFLLGRQLVAPNLNMMWGVPTVEQYMPLQLRHFAELRRQPGWLDESGVRWLLAPATERADEGWRSVSELGEMGLYRHDEWTQAWLRTTPDAGAREDIAVVTCEDGHRVTLSVESPRAAYLVTNYTWLPWWQATVNGNPVPVQRSDIAFCAVPVPPGHSVVELRYRQPKLREGAIISALSLILLFALLVWECRRGR